MSFTETIKNYILNDCKIMNNLMLYRCSRKLP